MQKSAVSRTLSLLSLTSLALAAQSAALAEGEKDLPKVHRENIQQLKRVHFDGKVIKGSYSVGGGCESHSAELEIKIQDAPIPSKENPFFYVAELNVADVVPNRHGDMCESSLTISFQEDLTSKIEKAAAAKGVHASQIIVQLPVVGHDHDAAPDVVKPEQFTEAVFSLNVALSSITKPGSLVQPDPVKEREKNKASYCMLLGGAILSASEVNRLAAFDLVPKKLATDDVFKAVLKINRGSDTLKEYCSGDSVMIETVRQSLAEMSEETVKLFEKFNGSSEE